MLLSTESVLEEHGTVLITAGGLSVASLATASASQAVPSNLKNTFAAQGFNEEEFLHLTYPLVHEGVNLNGDEFTKDEMKQAFSTLIGTPLDKDHSQDIDDIVGRHYNARYEEVGGTGVIVCDAYVYALIYPDIAIKLVDGVINGVSMETQFKWAEKTQSKRTLHGLNFIGAGLVRIPADPQARVSIKAGTSQAKVEALAIAIARNLKELRA